ncbi:MAG: hypothetical protein IKD95_07855, partial [Bacteroidales bacterium]|nr:hypothetical protein [Bacteroidales bacterium]
MRYVSFETTSDENSTTHPSNLLEVKLSEQLVKEMKAIGITDAAVDEIFNYLTKPTAEGGKGLALSAFAGATTEA